MANFNAGAIEGTLTLDRSPFNRDLKEAIAAAKAFEKEKIKIPLEITGMEKLDELKAELDGIRDETVNIDLEVDGDDQVGLLEERLNAIRDETVTIEINTDAAAEIARLEAELAAIPDETVTVEVDTDSGVNALKRLAGERDSIRGMTVLIGALIAILPAVVPVALAAAAAVGALVSVVGILAAGIAAFALVAIPAWKRYTTAVKAAKGDLSQLPPQMRALKEEQIRFNEAMQNSHLDNRVYALVGGAISILTNVMIKARPLIEAVAIAFSHVLTQVDAFVKSPLFTRVVQFLTANFEPALQSTMAVLGNLILFLGGVVAAFEPFSREFMGGLAGMTAAWAKWADGLSSSKKFQDFLAYVRETGPKVIEVFVSFSRAIGNIGKALAPLGGPVLDVLIDFFNAIGKMNTSVLGAIVVGLGAIVVLVIAATVAMAAFDAVAALNPFVAIAIAIIALVAAFLYLWKTNEGFRNFFIGTWNAIWGFMKAVGAWFAGPFAGFFVTGFNAVVGAVQAVWAFMVAAWNAITGAVTAAVNAIKAVVTAVFNAIKFVIFAILDTIMAYWRTFWNIFGGVITAGINLVKAIFGLGFAVMRLIVNTAAAAIMKIVNAMWANIKAATSSAVNVVKTVVSAAWNFIKSVSSSVWNAIKSAVSAAVNAIKGPVSSAVNAIKSAVSTAWNAVKSVTSSVWNGLSGIVSSALGKVISTVSSIVGQIKGIFSGAASWLYDAGRNIIQGLLNGITSLIDAVTSKLKALTDKIPKVKGPEERDKHLLEPAGRLIMGGFNRALDEGIAETLDKLAGFTGQIPTLADVTQALTLQPTVGAAAFPQPAPGLTKEDFVQLVSQLIAEIRANTQPLIGEFKASDQSPKEIAEEWWFITKGRG